MKIQLTLHKNNARRTAMFVALFTLSAIAFTACDKQNALVEPKTENTEAHKFSYQGKLYEAEEFERLFKGHEFPLMVMGADTMAPNTIYVFDSKAGYQSWAQMTPLAGKLAQIDEAVAKARNNLESNSSSLAKSSGVGGWATLYDGYYAGYTFYAPATSVVSALGLFDNLTSTVRVYNPAGSYATICSLYALPGFQGSQFIVLWMGSGTTTSMYLPSQFWDNLTSSFIVL